MNTTPSKTGIDSVALFGDGVAALLPPVLSPLLAAYEAQRGSVDMAKLQPVKAFGGGGAPYQLLEGGVANIPLSGLLMQRPGLLLRIFFGATDLVEFRDAIAEAAADSAVRSIILSIDSPGGSVLGPPEVAAVIEEVCRSKPIVAWTDGIMASAAYWIGSACSSIYASGPTVTTGSIGVVATHKYQPSQDGSTTTEVTAGKFKRMASNNAPLSAEGLAHIQSRVDYLAGVFNQAVARGRGMTPAQVAALEAATFIGAQGIDAGLLDGMVSFNALAADLAADPGRYMRRRQAVRSVAPVAPVAIVGGYRTPAAASVIAPHAIERAPAPSAVARIPEPRTRTLAEQKADAAECLKKSYARNGFFSPRVQTVEDWEYEANERAKKDGCDFITALQRVGFVHSLISLPPMRAAM